MFCVIKCLTECTHLVYVYMYMCINLVSDGVVTMDLMVCIRNMELQTTDHLNVRTRADSSLRDSLENVLDQPVTRLYRLVDPELDWDTTRAREFKVTSL